jgi:DeoR family fructose operon transcriptional repressor
MDTIPAEGSGDRVRHLPAGRRSDLAQFVAENGQVTVALLAERYGVSIDTIRRDLDQLDADGVLVRTHGGAVSGTSRPPIDRGLDVRLRMQPEEKEAIAERAAGLVEDGSVIIINAGTTALAVARHLHDHRDLTIATNNLRLPSELSPKVFRDLYVFGGSVRSITQSTTGPVTLGASPSGGEVDLHCDLALISVGAVSPTSGFSTSNLGDAAMMSEMMSRASKVAVLADSSKLGRRLFAQVSELGRADYFVTDSRPPADLEEALIGAGVQILTP